MKQVLKTYSEQDIAWQSGFKIAKIYVGRQVCGECRKNLDFGHHTQYDNCTHTFLTQPSFKRDRFEKVEQNYMKFDE